MPCAASTECANKMFRSCGRSQKGWVGAHPAAGRARCAGGSAAWGLRFVWAGGGAPPRAFCKAPAGAGAPTPRLPPYLRKELCKQLSSAIEGAVPPQANVPGGASARAGHGGRCWGVGASRGTGRPASWRRARRPGLPLPRGQVQAPSTFSHLAPWTLETMASSHSGGRSAEHAAWEAAIQQSGHPEPNEKGEYRCRCASRRLRIRILSPVRRQPFPGLPAELSAAVPQVSGVRARVHVAWRSSHAHGMAQTQGEHPGGRVRSPWASPEGKSACISRPDVGRTANRRILLARARRRFTACLTHKAG